MNSTFIVIIAVLCIIQAFLCGYFLGEQSGNKETQNHLLKKGGIPDV